jgi:hypothetical protein
MFYWTENEIFSISKLDGNLLESSEEKAFETKACMYDRIELMNALRLKNMNIS